MLTVDNNYYIVESNAMQNEQYTFRDLLTKLLQKNRTVEKTISKLTRMRRVNRKM